MPTKASSSSLLLAHTAGQLASEHQSVYVGKLCSVLESLFLLNTLHPLPASNTPFLCPFPRFTPDIIRLPMGGKKREKLIDQQLISKEGELYARVTSRAAAFSCCRIIPEHKHQRQFGERRDFYY